MAQDLILVVDMGSEDAQHIARSVRNAGVYCEIVQHPERLLERGASGWIFIGGEQELPAEIANADVPMLALGEACGPFLRAVGGSVGAFVVQQQVLDVHYEPSPVFMEIEDGLRRIQRACALTLPDNWQIIAETEQAALAFSDAAGKRIGLQFMPERNDVDGYRMLANFMHIVCGCDANWTSENFLESAVEGLRNRVGSGMAICPMTGGVDSAVSAMLAYRALGERAICLFIDTGLNGEGQAETFEKVLGEMGVPVRRVAAGNRMMLRLEGVRDPAQKRLVVADEFRRIVNEQRLKAGGEGTFVVQGTIYGDVLYPEEHKEAMRKLDEEEGVIILEPLRTLFKYEVRSLGSLLGMPESLVNSQHYPSAGLALRCMGEVTPQRIGMLRKADAVFTQIVEEAGADKGLTQYFAVLTDMHTLDSRGGRNGAVIVLRAVISHRSQSASAARLSYDVLESAVNAILREVPGVDRVLYDLSPKPPAEVELE